MAGVSRLWIGAMIVAGAVAFLRCGAELETTGSASMATAGGCGGACGGIGGAGGTDTTSSAGGGPSCGTKWVPRPASHNCANPVCGNGVREGCEFEDIYLSIEGCDGADLGGSSCEAEGYLGGILTCERYCELDTSACERCAPLTNPLLACGLAPVDAFRPLSFDLASSATHASLAWVSLDPNHQSGVRFALLAPDLSVLTATGPYPTVCPSEVAIAPRSGGWMLAARSLTGIELLAIDEAGTLLATSQVAPGGESPMLAGDPDGGVLLVWLHVGELHAVVAASDLSSIGPVQTLPVPPSDPVFDTPASVVFVANGFLVASRAQGTVSVLRIELDGFVQPSAEMPAPQSVELPRLTANGADVRLTFYAYSNDRGYYWMRLTPEGAAASTPVEIADHMTYGGAPAPHAPFGTDSVVLLPFTGDTNYPVAFEVLRLGPEGQTTKKPWRVVSEPYSDPARTKIVAIGNDVIAAWLNNLPPTLGMARLAP